MDVWGVRGAKPLPRSDERRAGLLLVFSADLLETCWTAVRSGCIPLETLTL
jgi:hypothetical protein